MNKIIIILFAVSFYSCGNGCDDVQTELIKMENDLATKRQESESLYKKLSDTDVFNDDQISEHQLVEDELMMVLIEIAVLEINIENYKEDYSRCL